MTKNSFGKNNKKRLEAQGKTIIMFLIVLLTPILLLNFISALEFDNTKSIKDIKSNEVLDIGLKAIPYQEIWSKYKPIEINNAFGLGEKLFTGAIIEHTSECSSNCESVMEIYLEKDGVLIQDVLWEKQVNGKWIDLDFRNYQIWISNTATTEERDVYETQCNPTGKLNINGTAETICERIKTGTEIVTLPEYRLLNIGEEVEAGNYRVKITGNKKPQTILDWKIKTQGIVLSEWAEWGTGGILIDTEINYATHGVATAPQGIEFVMKGDYDLFAVQLGNYSGNISNATKVHLLNGSGINVANGTIINGRGFINYSLINGKNYTITADSDGEAYYYVQKTPSGFPISKTELNYTRGYATDGNYYSIYAWEFAGIEIADGSYITLNSPTNNYISNTPNIDFNCSANVVGATLVNISLWNNVTGSWELEETQIKTGTSNTSIFSKTITPNIIWNCQGCDSDGDCGFAPSNYTLWIDATAPVISLVSGNGTQGYGNLLTNHTINYTITDSNLDSCWLNYNSTNTTIPCTSGETNSTNFQLQLDLYNATLWANDSLGNVGSESFEWDYIIFNNNETYDETAYETSSQNYFLNLTYNSSLYSVQPILNYDGTNYSSINLGSGDNGYFKVNLEVPLISVDANKTLFWYLVYSGTGNGIVETEHNNQTISQIILTQCSGTYTIKSLNFTMIDETTQININATSNVTDFRATFNYWIGSGNIKKNYSFQNLSSTLNNYQFCVNLNNSIISDGTIQYTANGYAEKEYNFNSNPLTNITQNINLYLLQDSLGTKFFHTARQGTEVIVNQLIEIQKFFVGEGIYKTIGIRNTDVDGKFIEYLELDKEYKYILGNSTLIRTSICSSAPCEVILQFEETILSAYDSFYEYFAQNIVYSLTNNETTKIVTLNFLDNLGTAQYWRLFVYQGNYNNDTLITICDEKSYSVSGTLTCNYSSYNGDIVAKAYISRGPEKLVEFISFINNNYAVVFGLSAILASIILLLVTIFAGTRNPAIALILIPFDLIILKFIGFLPLSWGWIVGITIFDLWIISKLKT